MLGMRGDEEEQPASRRAGMLVSSAAGEAEGWICVQSNIMAMAMRIMSTWW